MCDIISCLIPLFIQTNEKLVVFCTGCSIPIIYKGYGETYRPECVNAYKFDSRIWLIKD